jgi:hypothetical protein
MEEKQNVQLTDGEYTKEVTRLKKRRRGTGREL